MKVPNTSWFGPKTVGWGLRPTTWQGWFVTLVFTGLFLTTLYGARTMTITVAHLQPAISLLAGILILIMPRLLNYIVAIYLILAGLLGLGLLR